MERCKVQSKAKQGKKKEGILELHPDPKHKKNDWEKAAILSDQAFNCLLGISQILLWVKFS